MSAATPHLWRVNFELLIDKPQSVQGYGETLYTTDVGQFISKSGEYYGVPMGFPINRLLTDVAAETVTTAAGEITFGAIVEALPLFFARWAQEDVASGATGVPRSP